MDENEILVGELRKYLSNTPPKSPNQESEHVLQLKRELNLAARVGQQILMQLKATEKAKEVSELEIVRLKSQNAQLIHDNQKLAIEQDLLAASIEQQVAELNTLTSQLQNARLRTEQMTRAMASARALEREVEILTDLHASLRQELEASNLQRDEAEKLAKKLAMNLSRHLEPALNELTANTPTKSGAPILDLEPEPITIEKPNTEFTTNLDTLNHPSSSEHHLEHNSPAKPVLPVKMHPTLAFQFLKNSESTQTTQTNTQANTQFNTRGNTETRPELRKEANTHAQNVSLDSMHTPNMSLPSLIEDLSLDESEIHNHSSTDLSWLGEEDLSHSSAYWMQPSDTASPLRPRLHRSQSQESVFSVNPNDSAPMLRPLRMDNLSNAKQTLAAVNGEQYGEPVKLVRHGARDKLSAMRGVPDRRRWGFFLH